MKNLKHFITGLTLLTAFIVLSPTARAATDPVCNTNTIQTHYKAVYCGMRMINNTEADAKIVRILSAQFGISEDLIKEILADSICNTVKDYPDTEKAKLPAFVQLACLPSGSSVNESLGSWNKFTDIKNAYNKEKAILRSQTSQKFKFKASEQYWDGEIGLINDAPFDLIVDLNLIDIVLFGSKAQWMNDVFAFPKDEEEGSAGGGPVSGLPPETGTPEEGEGLEEPTEPGLTVGEETTTKPPLECVPPDDPEADLGDGPGSDNQSALCGNGTVDVLLGETCDDGNTQSGDGCSQYCQTEATGSNDICQDPEAVTFKKPNKANEGSGAGTAGGEVGEGNQTPKCPPGSVPKKSADISGEGAGPAQEVPQSPEYPGPFVGGTLKQYPDSNPPLCPPGRSPLAIDTPNIETENEEGEDDFTITSETQYLKDGDGNVRCLPTEWCRDPDKTRTFLAALPPLLIVDKDWKDLPDDSEKKQWIESIESIFCVNLTKANRPLSPYQLIEGCIDCHITAMVDSLEKTLQTNVSPLRNTTSAFSISSRYGASASFNLSTATKAKVKYKTTNTALTALDNANKNLNDSIRANKPISRTVSDLKGPLSQILRNTDGAAESQTAVLEDIQSYRIGSGAVSDQEVGARINPLLFQMKESFANIQSVYEQIVFTTALNEKKQCQ